MDPFSTTGDVRTRHATAMQSQATPTPNAGRPAAGVASATAPFATMLARGVPAGAPAGCGCMHAPTSTVDAGAGQRQLVAGGGSGSGPAPTSLQGSLAQLQASLAQLQRLVAAFAQRLAPAASGAASGAGATTGVAGVSGGGAAGTAGAAPMKGSSIGSRVAGATSTAPMKGSSPIVGGGALPTNATSRTNAIPDLRPGQTEPLTLARGQVTYRQVGVTGAAGGTTIQPPAATAGADVELFALRDYRKGAHTTQVLEPITGPTTIPAGQTVQLIARVKGTQPGTTSVDVAGARLQVTVGTTSVDALPMMAWVNESNASRRGTTATGISKVLAHFGVAATGNSGVAVSSTSKKSPVQYFSAAYEAATRQSPVDTARRIVEAERKAGAANPGAKFWVQVSDEQDTTASQVTGTVGWIKQLRAELQKHGSDAKLFVAAQAKPDNLAYASVVDGWATTQSAAGRTRDQSINDIQRASQGYGRSIELMEYPGNAFLDAGTTGGAAISTASAALDGASSWFLYSANNLDTLEQGGGDEGKGDIGGLVAIDNGRVLPTIALIEAELGANLGAAARVVGGTAMAGNGAGQIRAAGDQLDAYKHSGSVVDLRTWEREIGASIR